MEWKRSMMIMVTVMIEEHGRMVTGSIVTEPVLWGF